MGAYIEFLKKALPKPLKGQKIVRPEKIIEVPKPQKFRSGWSEPRS